ncbi:unnamed protein product [Callosobruchus maculatus]|uniref:Uncharacterized protein n=1 Tax=Callosobruchus maculatus TaxID=64391 RepID=A0A653BJG5_CALMS|nr:unnamed protein product [Callosobruchus maculatus]
MLIHCTCYKLSVVRTNQELFALD